MSDKTIKHSTKKKTTSKKVVPYYEAYYDYFLRRKKPVSEAFLDKLSVDLVAWYNENEKAMIATEFFTLRGICRDTAYSWMKRHKAFKAAYKHILTIIAERRDRGAMNKELDGNYIAKTMRCYSEKWREAAKWDADLKHKYDKELIALKAKLNQGDEAQKNTVVVIERYPKTDIVPERPLKNDLKEVESTLENNHG